MKESIILFLLKNANGTYEKIEYKIEDGYLIYETDELGIVSIIGDKEITQASWEPIHQT